ncbi:uncharacterized protein [Hoplias malabaricus]|uniref:uncharacterized protein isoform X2 n=1 Tax=Hoplias malabaricus TaxID=27720 RepID=UPI003461FC5A
MKRSSLNFLKPKSPNLFDTSVQIKHYDNVEYTLDSAVIPESGTAKVRSRPTVKHFSASGDGSLGFAVPTPTVPVLLTQNGTLIENPGSTEGLCNGEMISITDPEEGEIMIPAPPSVAPPPPPPQFIPPSPHYIPPPPEFLGDLDPSVDLAELQPPSMPPPKPPSTPDYAVSEKLDLTSLKSPPMAPPKPPNDTSASLSEPKFTPPPEKPESPLPKIQKMPPPKPVRLSSMHSLDLTPAPVSAATPASSFKPQTTAKLYSVPKGSVLSSRTEQDSWAQHILLLEDSSGNPVGVHINGKPPIKEVIPAEDMLLPVKPLRRNSLGVQLEKEVEDQQERLPKEPTNPSKTVCEDSAITVASQDIPHKTLIPVTGSPKTERASPTLSVQEQKYVKDQPNSPSRPRSYSPLLNHKLKTLRGQEGAAGKESLASPLALLKAAKEREKQRMLLSRQSSNKSSSSVESMNVSIHPSETRPNSFTVTPLLASSENPESQLSVPAQSQPKPQSPNISRSQPKPSSFMNHPNENTSASSPAQHTDLPFIPPPPEFANSDSEDEAPPSTPPPDPPAKSVVQFVNSSIPAASSPATLPKSKPPIAPLPPAGPSTNPQLIRVQHKPQADILIPAPPPTKPPAPPSTQVPVAPSSKSPAPPSTQINYQIPAPPSTKPPAPPSTQPPAPPSNKPPAPPSNKPPAPPSTQPPAPPPTQTKAQTSAQIPILPPSQPPNTKPKTQLPEPPIQPKTQVPSPSTQPKIQLPAPPTQHKNETQVPSQPPPSVSASHATLLSILQKKMLEMDPKFTRTREVDPSGDDWNFPLSDDDGATSPLSKTAPKPKSPTLPMQTQGLDMKELETKVAKKAQDLAKAPSNTHLKQQYGMTFTVRPGTKQPITPVIKLD